MALRRGFKSEANWYARSFRLDLGMPEDSALCPFDLAHHLGVAVLSLTEFRDCCPDEVAYFHTAKGRKEFSALTAIRNEQRLVIYNDANSAKRSNADVMHELAHIVLFHPPKPPISPDGSRHYDGVLEEEANWLGPALLVSDEAAVSAARNGWTLSQSSDFFGVSEELVRMRLNVSGAYKRISRAA
jgi:Zn-dependent peptidase ImmA (M78 family)